MGKRANRQVHTFVKGEMELHKGEIEVHMFFKGIMEVHMFIKGRLEEGAIGWAETNSLYLLSLAVEHHFMDARLVAFGGPRPDRHLPVPASLPPG